LFVAEHPADNISWYSAEEQVNDGVPCEYHFIRTNIPFSMKINFSFFRNPDMQMAMADQNTYVPHLLQMYNEGYRLLSFQLTPGSVH
jgi:hypothetical protein